MRYSHTLQCAYHILWLNIHSLSLYHSSTAVHLHTRATKEVSLCGWTTRCTPKCPWDSKATAAVLPAGCQGKHTYNIELSLKYILCTSLIIWYAYNPFGLVTSQWREGNKPKGRFNNHFSISCVTDSAFHLWFKGQRLLFFFMFCVSMFCYDTFLALTRNWHLPAVWRITVQ